MSNMPKIIAICGAKRSGKDVLADYLVKKYNYERLAFADPLKLVVKKLFNFEDDQVGIGEDEGTDKKDIIDERWGITPRAALQFFGTEVMQEKIQELLPNIKRNFFANTLKNHIENAEEGKKFVISDLRFIHEYDMLANLSNVAHKDKMIIRVIRPSKHRTKEQEPHISEVEYTNIPYDIIMINNGSIDEYISRFEKLIRI
jgi:hypothetical protein|uniref:Deoxynucleoside monophosphate kinase n=1 Tax=viral metagenome TaxID=1070528 RepID=A0A6C0LVY3_9ZZZZ